MTALAALPDEIRRTTTALADAGALCADLWQDHATAALTAAAEIERFTALSDPEALEPERAVPGRPCGRATATTWSRPAR